MRAKFSKVLCATDFSATSQRALVYADLIARQFNATLLLCHVADLSGAGLYDMSAQVFTRAREKVLSEAADEMRALMAGRTKRWEPVVAEGFAAIQIPRLAEQHQVDLVVAGTHGRSGVSRLLLGSVAERLQKTLDCPFLAVRDGPANIAMPLADDLRFRRILVGCDFSTDSSRAIEHALSLAQEFEAEVDLIHVFEPSDYARWVGAPAGIASDLERAVRETVHAKLAGLVSAEQRTWCDVKTLLAVGKPHEEIAKHARTAPADLIVLGVRGHSAVEEILVGSTAERVLRAAHCPVLTVKASAAT
jgi:nucleotide-binding universal stress UspA family protein